jgi:2-polyprenyl-6-methoxyphenol hydroxylase-like FAD-dependent oxidoreductase
VAAGRAVIVGAGPAGASLSYLLARRGVGVTLVERHTDFAREFRGEVLMPSGLDALAQMGLGEKVAALPQVRLERIEVYRGDRRLFAVTLADLGVAETPRIVSQPALLEMLVAEANRFPAFELRRGATARDLLRTNGRVRGVRVEDANGALELEADLVVGTDGRGSVLRSRSGLDEVRTPQAFDVVWCKVPLPPFFDRGTARAFLGRGHSALTFPSYDGRLQIGWLIAKGTFGDLKRRGIEDWVDEMAAHVSSELGAHLRAHRRDVTHPFLLDVVSDHLVRWTAPGLLLLGDAAHPMSPVGGQGINVALRDVLVAANHLCPVLATGGGAEAIDAAARRVQEERLPEVETIQRAQQAPPPIIFGQRWWSGLFLDRLLPFLVRTGLAVRLFGALFRRFATGVDRVRLEV